MLVFHLLVPVSRSSVVSTKDPQMQGAFCEFSFFSTAFWIVNANLFLTVLSCKYILDMMNDDVVPCQCMIRVRLGELGGGIFMPTSAIMIRARYTTS